MSLAGHLIRRFLLIIPMTIGITMLLFIVTHAVPVDPLVVILNEKSLENPEAVRAATEKWGLDKPMPVQYPYFFHALATDVGLDVLVEIHDEPELERALAVGATLIGVNQRDLVTFEVDTDRAARMAPLMPDGVVRVAESGVRGPDDAARLADAGYHAVLVGESLVTAGDPRGGVAALRAAG